MSVAFKSKRRSMKVFEKLNFYTCLDPGITDIANFLQLERVKRI
jgi:hypothetical protein